MEDPISYQALFISDVHLSNRLPHAKLLPGTDVTDRFQQQLDIMEAVADRADLEQIQDIYVLGDLFDKPVLDTVTLRESTKCLVNLARNGRRVFIGAGNHEAPTVKGGNYVSEFIQHLPLDNIVYMGPGWMLNPVPWLRLWWTPWAPLHEAKEAIDDIVTQAHHAQSARRKEFGDDGNDVLLMHQSVNGCTAGGWKCEDGLDPKDVTCHFDAVISGHFHEPQEFGRTGMYLGSPLQLHFGDVGGQRVYWDMMFFQHDDATVTPCETQHSKFHQQEVAGPDEIKAPSEARAGDYLRFIVKCSPEEWTKDKTAINTAMKRISEDHGCSAKAVHRPTSKASIRLGAGVDSMAYEEMLGKYVELAKPDGLDEKWLGEIGRAALEAARVDGE